MAKSSTTTNDKDAKLKQHKRSRTGCYTCRLRRKKCDERKPCCKACHHLGLACDYKRPIWWSNNEEKAKRKELIKEAIRQTQLAKKDSATATVARPRTGTDTPPALCHYASTPEGSASSPLPLYPELRPISIEPTLHIAQEYSDPAHVEPYFLGEPQSCCYLPDIAPCEHPGSSFPQGTTLNSGFRQDSLFFSRSSFTVPPSDAPTPDANVWTDNLYQSPEGFDSSESEAEFFPLPDHGWTNTEQTAAVMPAVHQPTMDHFVNTVSRMIFPVLDATQAGSARTQVVLPALQSNASFVHCCMSVAGLHLKSSNEHNAPQIEDDIINHRCQAVGMVCEGLELDNNHEEILETTLALILYPTCAGAADETLIDIPWHEHFKIVQNLVERLSLQETILNADLFNPEHNTFAATLTAWIDILGATMRGQAPVFADTWRSLLASRRLIGMSDVMGCDDKIMYIISEIAYLDERKRNGMDELELCEYIERLGLAISSMDVPHGSLISAVAEDGSAIPSQLIANITALFRLAARIYLLSLVPGFAHDSPTMQIMITAFTDMMSLVPTAFTPSLAWPLLVVGGMSTPDCAFRSMLAERCATLGERAEQGSLARVQALLCSTWATNDFAGDVSGLQRVHWREVMAAQGGDWLCL